MTRSDRRRQYPGANNEAAADRESGAVIDHENVIEQTYRLPVRNNVERPQKTEGGREGYTKKSEAWSAYHRANEIVRTKSIKTLAKETFEKLLNEVSATLKGLLLIQGLSVIPLAAWHPEGAALGIVLIGLVTAGLFLCARKLGID